MNDLPLEGNVNRLETEGEARNVEEAIAVLRLIRQIHYMYLLMCQLRWNWSAIQRLNFVNSLFTSVCSSFNRNV